MTQEQREDYLKRFKENISFLSEISETDVLVIFKKLFDIKHIFNVKTFLINHDILMS